MKVVTTYTNFSRGRVDHDLQGRSDLPIYTTGADVFTNMVSNFKGNAIYRTGFKNITDFQDCAFIEFKFSSTQNYILVLYNLKMRFLSYDGSGVFGWVLSGGSPLEVTTPWSLVESKEIAFKKSFTQNFDNMIICHQDHEPRKLIRTGAAAFTLRTYARKSDPFPLTWAASKTITAVTQATTAQITTSAAHGYSVGDRVRIAAIVGMTELNGWTAAILTVPTSTTFTIDVDTTSFTAYSSAGTTEKVSTGDYPKTVSFYRARLAYAATAAKTTTVFISEAGEYFSHEVPATVVDDSPLTLTIAEMTNEIEWIYPGGNSLIVGSGDAICALNGGSADTPLTALTAEVTRTSAEGCSQAEPLEKDGYIFYASRNKRNYYYFQYDLLTETFKSRDANVIAYELSKPLLSKSRLMRDRNDLVYIFREDGTIASMVFNESENIIGWHEYETEGTIQDIAVITDNDGNPQLFLLVIRDSVYYIEQLSAYPEFKKRADFFTDSEDDDDEAYNRYVAQQLKETIYLDGAETTNNLRTETITYDSGAGTITASGSVFSSGDVGKHIVYRTATGYESGRFEITAYTSATVVSVDVLQTPTANSYSDWYLSFSTLSGLSRFNGMEISVCVDGSYYDDVEVSGGTITLNREVTTAVVGYKYKGTIKSFPLGFQVRAENTQSTMKAVTRIGVRAVGSWGGEFGTSFYRLEPIQELSQDDLNYLPPAPIDGTKYLSYSDDNNLDQSFYFVQNTPTPFQVCALLIDTNYTVTK